MPGSGLTRIPRSPFAVSITANDASAGREPTLALDVLDVQKYLPSSRVTVAYREAERVKVRPRHH